MNKHTLTIFEYSLDELKSDLSRMGGLVEKLCKDGIEAFLSGNTSMIDSCINQDKEIDELEKSINEKTMKILALQAPMANDLRMIISSLRIASCLERCGDYGKNLGRRSSLALNEETLSPVSYTHLTLPTILLL